MVLTFTIPEPGNKKRVKDVLINLLISEWPLTLSQLHKKIKREYRINTSCQAVYKAISELNSEGVVLKQEKNYSIDLEWIKKLKEFSEHIENNYKEKDTLPLIEGLLKVKSENNVTVLTFNSMLELDKTWLKIKKEYYSKITKPGEITFWEGNHCWWLLVYPELEYDEMELVKKKKVKDFIINHNDTKLDLWTKKFYDMAGIGFKITKSKVNCDLTVFGDTIMQVYWPEELKIKTDEIFEKYDSISNINLHSLLEKIFNKKTKIDLIITKNNEIAEQLKSKIKKEFN